MIETIEATWRSVAAIVMSVYVAVNAVVLGLPEAQAFLPANIYDLLAGMAAQVSAGLTAVIGLGGIVVKSWQQWRANRAPVQ